MKICTKCKLEQPLENFKKEKSNKNKHRTICKNCDDRTGIINKLYKLVEESNIK